MLGRALVVNGQLDEARVNFEEALRLDPENADVKDHLAKGRPLIVALKPGRGPLHYVVVAGVDWEQGVVLANDPAERKLLKSDRSSFEKEWKAAGNWTLLAVPQPASS